MVFNAYFVALHEMTAGSERGDCESYLDCELPTETWEVPEDGETVVCPDCGREWVYEGGYFTQTGRRVTATGDGS